MAREKRVVEECLEIADLEHRLLLCCASQHGTLQITLCQSTYGLVVHYPTVNRFPEETLREPVSISLKVFSPTLYRPRRDECERRRNVLGVGHGGRRFQQFWSKEGLVEVHQCSCLDGGVLDSECGNVGPVLWFCCRPNERGKFALRKSRL